MSRKNANRFTLLEAVEASIAVKENTSDLHKLDRDLFIHLRELLPTESILRKGCWCIVKNNKNTFNLCGNTFDNLSSVFCKAHGAYSAGSPTATMVILLQEIGKLTMEKHHAHHTISQTLAATTTAATSTSSSSSSSNDALQQKLLEQQVIIDRYNTLEHAMNGLEIKYRFKKQQRVKQIQSEIKTTVATTPSPSTSDASSTHDIGALEESLKRVYERALTAEAHLPILKTEIGKLQLEIGGMKQLITTLEVYKQEALEYQNLQFTMNSLKLKYRAEKKKERKNTKNNIKNETSTNENTTSATDHHPVSSSSHHTDTKLGGGITSDTKSLVQELTTKIINLQSELETKSFIIETQNTKVTSLHHELTELQEKYNKIESSNSHIQTIENNELSNLRTQIAQTQDKYQVLQAKYNELENTININKITAETKQMDNQTKQENEWLLKINELTTLYTQKLNDADQRLQDETKQYTQSQKNHEIQIEALRKQLDDKQTQLLHNEELLRGIRMEVELLHNEKENIIKNNEKLIENQRKEYEVLLNEANNATQQANNEVSNTAETLLATREALQDALVRQSETNAGISDVQEEVVRLRQDKVQHEQKIAELVSSHEQIIKEKQHNEQIIHQLTEQLQYLQQDITQHKAQIQAKGVEIQVINEQLSKATNESSHLSTHIENLTAQLDASKRYSIELEKQLHDISSTVAERNLRTLLTDAETKVKNAEATILEVQATNDSLRTQLEDVRNAERHAVTELRELRIIENELRIQISELKALKLGIDNPYRNISSSTTPGTNNKSNITTDQDLVSPLKTYSPAVNSNHSLTPVNIATPGSNGISSTSKSTIVQELSSIPQLEPPTPLSNNWGLHTPEQITNLQNSLHSEQKIDPLQSSLTLDNTEAGGAGVETRTRASMAATLRVEEYMRASAEVDRLSDLRTRLEALTARYSNSGSKLPNSNQKYKVLTPGSLLSNSGLSPASAATAYLLTSPQRSNDTLLSFPSIGTNTINLQNPPSRVDYGNRQVIEKNNNDSNPAEILKTVSTPTTVAPVRQLQLDG